MDPVQIARAYFDAWNRRDAAAVLATFTSDGTYSDPSGGRGLRGDALVGYMNGLWAAFPDLSFEIASAGATGSRLCGRRMGHARHEPWLDDGSSTNRQIDPDHGRRFHPHARREDSVSRGILRYEDRCRSNWVSRSTSGRKCSVHFSSARPPVSQAVRPWLPVHSASRR